MVGKWHHLVAGKPGALRTLVRLSEHASVCWYFLKCPVCWQSRTTKNICFRC